MLQLTSHITDWAKSVEQIWFSKNLSTHAIDDSRALFNRYCLAVDFYAACCVWVWVYEKAHAKKKKKMQM